MKLSNIIRNALKINSITLLSIFTIQYVYNNYVIHNISISAPIGYYLMFPIKSISKGNRYLICLDQSKYLAVMFKLGLLKVKGQCMQDSPYLLKKVVGVNGDTVAITESGILINGVKLANSKPIQKHNGIDLLPQPNSTFILKQNEYFVMGDTPTSYDSRYYGVIDRNQFKKRAFGFLSN